MSRGARGGAGAEGLPGGLGRAGDGRRRPAGRGGTERDPAARRAAPGPDARSSPRGGHSWARSFAFAAEGLRRAWRSERNLRVQCAAGAAALDLAWFVALPAPRLAVLLLAVAAVLATEILNTAVEAAVDLASPGRQPLAGAAKDLAAGAVLCMALGAVAAGMALFAPDLARPMAALAWGWRHRPAAVWCGAGVEVLLAALAAAPVQKGGARRSG